jgi:hypothetical protein
VRPRVARLTLIAARSTREATAHVCGHAVAATASFAETDNCVPSLASGSTCKINVTFTPAAAGETSGVLSISDDAPGSPQKGVADLGVLWEAWARTEHEPTLRQPEDSPIFPRVHAPTDTLLCAMNRLSLAHHPPYGFGAVVSLDVAMLPKTPSV